MDEHEPRGGDRFLRTLLTGTLFLVLGVLGAGAFLTTERGSAWLKGAAAPAVSGGSAAWPAAPRSGAPALSAPAPVAASASPLLGLGAPVGEPAAAAPRPAQDRLIVRGAPEIERAEESTEAFVEAAPLNAPARRAGGGQPAASRASAPAAPAYDAQAYAEPVAIRYGATTRDGLMGRGAGPVYNLNGRGAAKAPDPNLGAVIRQSRAVVEQAREKVEKTTMPEDARRQALTGLDEAERQMDRVLP